jgi:hypothetical protein
MNDPLLNHTIDVALGTFLVILIVLFIVKIIRGRKRWRR